MWLNGQKAADDPAAEQVLVSPVLQRGESFTFRVRARWQADGQTYEYAKDVTLGPGERSRLTVYSGTAVNEK